VFKIPRRLSFQVLCATHSDSARDGNGVGLVVSIARHLSAVCATLQASLCRVARLAQRLRGKEARRVCSTKPGRCFTAVRSLHSPCLVRTESRWSSTWTRRSAVTRPRVFGPRLAFGSLSPSSGTHTSISRHHAEVNPLSKSASLSESFLQTGVPTRGRLPTPDGRVCPAQRTTGSRKAASGRYQDRETVGQSEPHAFSVFTQYDSPAL
jgi:hypothetical protein